MNINLRVILYESETWSLALREELRVFEHIVLMRVFGPGRGEVEGGAVCLTRSPKFVLTIIYF
jgi:hypothetical protein